MKKLFSLVLSIKLMVAWNKTVDVAKMNING